jgi:hypothetical protein
MQAQSALVVPVNRITAGSASGGADCRIGQGDIVDGEQFGPVAAPGWFSPRQLGPAG